MGFNIKLKKSDLKFLTDLGGKGKTKELKKNFWLKNCHSIKLNYTCMIFNQQKIKNKKKFIEHLIIQQWNCNRPENINI